MGSRLYGTALFGYRLSLPASNASQPLSILERGINVVSYDSKRELTLSHFS